MKNYFTGDFHADSYLMYDYLSQLEMYTGNERSGDRFFTKQKGSKQSHSFKFGFTWRKRRGTGEREYCPIKKMYKSKAMEDNPWLLDMFKEYSNRLRFKLITKLKDLEPKNIWIKSMLVILY